MPDPMIDPNQAMNTRERLHMIAGLNALQRHRNAWVEHNFTVHGNSWDLLESALGMVEEMGELAHHILKRQQSIRGTHEEHTAEIEDAICDVIIFALGVAKYEGFQLGDALDRVWQRVSQRDWKADPSTGGGLDTPTSDESPLAEPGLPPIRCAYCGFWHAEDGPHVQVVPDDEPEMGDPHVGGGPKP